MPLQHCTHPDYCSGSCLSLSRLQAHPTLHAVLGMSTGMGDLGRMCHRRCPKGTSEDMSFFTAQLQALLVLAKARLWLPKPQLPLTDSETLERLGLPVLPLFCAALKASASTCFSLLLLMQAEFLEDWAHWSRWQRFLVTARAVNPDLMLRPMPKPCRGHGVHR